MMRVRGSVDGQRWDAHREEGGDNTRIRCGKSASLPTIASASAKRVTFASEPRIQFVEDNSEETHLWYAPSDFESFVREKYQHALLITVLQRFCSKGHYSSMALRYAERRLEQSDATPVGLEDTLSLLSASEAARRSEAHNRAILEEQRRQLKVGDLDPDIMAKVSSEKSKWASERSLAIGALHAEEGCRSILLEGREKSVTPTEEHKGDTRAAVSRDASDRTRIGATKPEGRFGPSAAGPKSSSGRRPGSGLGQSMTMSWDNSAEGDMSDWSDEEDAQW